MTISIPDTFTVDYSENYILSIRLKPDGFSFTIHNPSEQQDSIYREIEFDRTIPYITSLKELFFANDFLVWTYKRIYLLVVTPQYVIVPDTVFIEENKDRLISFNFMQPEKRIIINSLKDDQAQNIFTINDDIYEFCVRTLINPVCVHHITPQLITQKKQIGSENENHLFVVIHSDMIDISCFAKGRLVFANSFIYNHFNDLLYYILYVWHQMNLNQLSDLLSLAGQTSICNKVSEALHTYIQHIGRIEIPSEAYLRGGELLQAPTDLILLSLCEL